MTRGFTHESTHNESKEWYTPRYIFDALGCRFDMDVCSPGSDVVPWIPADTHLTIQNNGLAYNWYGLVWCNPPYGSDTPAWLKRMEEHGNGIALVFSRTDTNWFHRYAVAGEGILFIASRIKFINANQATSNPEGNIPRDSSPGAASMLIAYGQVAFDYLRDAETRGLGVLFTPYSK